MDTQLLYDWTPLAGLLALGAAVALVPLAWVWRRHAHDGAARKWHALRVLTLFLTFDLVLFGAFTRLTDSGLGCPDWPGCYGSTSPVGAGGYIQAAQSALPSGPVTHAKAWIEMLHRYLAMAVGALILCLCIEGWQRWWQLRRAGSLSDGAPTWPWLASLTLVWVGVQGAFGALTVTMKLFPAIVTLHLLGALGLLVLLCVQVLSAAPTALLRSLPTALRRGVRWACVLLVVQIALGGWVSSNYAVLACSDFPTCQGRWWPDMDLRQGFELWRGLGMTGQGEPISFAALTGIHYVHRLMAWLVLGWLGWLAWRLNRMWLWRAPSRVLAVLLGLQLATGMSNVVLGWPLLAALLHTGGAAALLLLLTWMWVRSPDPAAQVLPDYAVLTRAHG
ncbi:MAG: heme A synthase [Comamonadaceae bacterium CG1_02_60_18]|nr:MAG: heme A synthase [Comamonadaceae bacterium CG1_02_60_18]PIQ53066.1 MAG: heme A synthase [Comamonadaceae bacterium CG12_big_fil_rev_8_21_14_0_65_59_15]